MVGMQLPGERMEALLEGGQVQSQFPRHAEKSEVIGALWKRLNFSAGRAKVRAAGGCRAVAAICRCRHGCGWRAHNLAGLVAQASSLWGLVLASTKIHRLEACATRKKWLAGSPRTE